MDTTAIEVQVNRVNRELDPTELEQIDLAVDSLYRIACDLRKAYRSRLLEVLTDEDGPKQINVGTKKYVATYPKQTDCADEPKTLEALLDFAQGDLAKVTEAFASKPFKHGYCKSVLPPEIYAACFKTEVKPTLKETDSAPVKQLVEMDERFIR